jgi:TolB-like protein/DNA-binding winged helix-turn-helix (wHTH) protein/tetratricopeptide (TPR) repeat protein
VAQVDSTHRSVHFGTFDLDLHSGELRKHGLKIRLPHQSFQILARLLERPGELVSREELRQALWSDDTFVDFETGLSSAVRKLRDALGDSAENARFIETLPKRGYRFIAPVIRTPETSSSVAAPVESVDGRPGLSLRTSTIAAIVLVVFAGLVIVGIAARYRVFFAARPTSIRSLAVLPLANLTGDPQQEDFVDGMTDSLITELAQIGDVRVISRTSVMRYKKGPPPTPVVGQELSVDAVVEGTVVRSGSRVRINAQLIDAKNDRHIWAHGYERDANDIVALQSDVARAIAEAIAGKLTPGREMPRTVSMHVSEDTYALFFKAMMTAGGGDFKGAITYAKAAVAKQPDFAPAYAATAVWYNQFAFTGGLSPQEFMPKAEIAARKAIALDETTSQAHAALGLVLYRFYWNWDGAEKEFRRALTINPSYAEGHRMLGVLLSLTGRASEALEEEQEARKLDPLSDNALFNLAVAHRDAGQNEQAISEFRTLLDKRPELGRAHAELGATYLAKGDLIASIDELQKAVNVSGRKPRTLADLGYADAVIGNKSDAHRILRDLKDLSTRQFISPVDLAAIQAALGQTQAAFASLDKACEVHDPQVSRLLIDERLNALRTDARFHALERRVGLPR